MDTTDIMHQGKWHIILTVLTRLLNKKHVINNKNEIIAKFL